jgi:hypothetical protein
MAEARTAVAALSMESAGGVNSLAHHWDQTALAAAQAATTADGRRLRLSARVYMPWCYADIVNPYPVPLAVQVPESTGAGASPVYPTALK